MECTAVRNWLFRKIDGELTERESRELNAHLTQCAFCAREYRLLSLPHRIAQTIPAFRPSPYFNQKLSTQIESEARSGDFWQAILSPALRIVPALACITFLLLSIFAYSQLHGPEIDLYAAYDKVFTTEDQSHRMFVAGDISDASVLSAIADWEISNRRSIEFK